VLLDLLVTTFAPTGPIVLGIDDTLERRWGKKIAAKGVYRDAVRSSKELFVKCSGLRWICLMLLVEIPWAKRVWALPFLTGLAPSQRYHQERGTRHEKLTDWARQLLLLVRRWLPERQLVVVADSSYAVLDWLARCARMRQPITIVTRLRLDAALYEPAPPRAPGMRGRPRLKGQRLPTLASRLADPTTVWTTATVPNWYGEGPRTVEIVSETAIWDHGGLPPVALRWVLIRDPEGDFDPQALLCTDLTADPAPILQWFVLRWQMEVTQEEVRRHLGVETQRQWSELAIRRTTPALLGLFSLVTLLAHPPMTADPPPVRQAAWSPKHDPTFTDALVLVRREPWNHQAIFCMSLHVPSGGRHGASPSGTHSAPHRRPLLRRIMGKVELSSRQHTRPPHPRQMGKVELRSATASRTSWVSPPSGSAATIAARHACTARAARPSPRARWWRRRLTAARSSSSFAP
jgi:hypothetical protein